jgi:hypothetical protein
MQPFFQDYLSLLTECHEGILKTLDGLPSAALDWIPGPETNSISVLVFHLTGAERYWIGDVLAGEPSGRDRDSEFKVRGVEGAALRQRLMDNLNYSRGVLEKLTLQDLEAERVAPKGGKRVTGGWALLHALEHASQHLGHIQLTRQLWEASGQS